MMHYMHVPLGNLASFPTHLGQLTHRIAEALHIIAVTALFLEQEGVYVEDGKFKSMTFMKNRDILVHFPLNHSSQMLPMIGVNIGLLPNWHQSSGASDGQRKIGGHSF